MAEILIDVEKQESLKDSIANVEQTIFFIEDPSTHNCYQIKHLLKTPDDKFNINQFTLHLFKADNIPENYIKEIFEKQYKKISQGNGRIGWIFPLQALVSNEHDYAEEIHFLRYADVAFQKLISSEPIYCQIYPECNIEKIYSINEFYEADSVVLILSNECTEKIADFEICNYLPALFGFGYSYNGQKLYDMREEIEFKTESKFKDNIGKKIVVAPISNEISESTYINRLFIELLCNEKHHLVKFQLLYQVIELLIENIYCNDIRSLIINVGEDAHNIHDIRSEFAKISDETNRIEKVFGEYTLNIGDKSELKDLCFELIKFVGGDDKYKEYSLGKCLYRVRNILVHNYRTLSEEAYTIINKINHCFEAVIIGLLIEWRKPTKDNA